MAIRYNPPPGWDVPLENGRPPAGFTPNPSWPPAPDGWEFWLKEQAFSSPSPLESDANLPHSSEEDFGPVVEDDDRKLLQAMGVYKYHHPLENVLAYEDKLDGIRAQIKKMIEEKSAVYSDTQFTLENSIAKGSKLTGDLAKLCLRSFNIEAETAIKTMRAGSLQMAKGRLEKSRTTIEKLGSMMSIKISDEYFALRLTELEIVSDYLVKKQEEKEAEREERARLREEKKVAEELERQKEKLEKELLKYQTALEKAGDNPEGKEEFEQKIAEIESAIEENDYRLKNTRAGYVYVISNPGAFGEEVVKIGMTRRLEPMDRIKELGDASVPFPFEVHLLHFDDDAFALENRLHNHFAERRLNLVNTRKEFFFASGQEVKEAIVEGFGLTVEFVRDITSEQYLQSKNSWIKPVN